LNDTMLQQSATKALRYRFNLGKTLAGLLDLIGMAKEVIQGKYKLSAVEWIIICSTIAYFFMPLDLLPDPIMVDDVAVIMNGINQLDHTLKAWRLRK